ncbi:MAG TPA: MazG family protein [Verrucomicrobiota bacterium]|nr:MazG family protein [Verrucomicrobiota bacterium]
MNKQHSNESEIQKLRNVVKILRSPNGCPWDKKQTHSSLRYNAVEEAYELIDAIERNNDDELLEELGDLLLQVVLHSQIAEERKAFDFDLVCKRIRQKLISRHPHVFGDSNVQTVDGVWSQWERLKLAEKKGTSSERDSVFDGIPKYLPALIYAEKVLKKSNRIGISLKLVDDDEFKDKQELAMMLFSLVQIAHSKGWSAEDLLRSEIKKIEKKLRKIESQTVRKKSETKSVKKTKNQTK